MTVSDDLKDYLKIDQEIENAVKNASEIEADEQYYSYEQWLTDNESIISASTMCPDCNRAYNIIHFECSEYIDVCTCPPGSKDNAYYCFNCDVLWDEDTGEVINDFSNGGDDLDYTENTLFDEDPNIYDEEFQKALTTGTNSKPLLNKKGKGVTEGSTKYDKTKWDNWTYVPQCSHKHDEMILSDGTKIYCSSARENSGDKIPDFGLYADYIWSPSWRNEFINWPDYGIPTKADVALVQIYEAYYRAKEYGSMVEIGCIGGHGRTGTILAIMEVAAADGKVTADEAIKWVRDKYCDNAIESSIQEWFIGYAAHKWFNHDLKDKPEPKSKNYVGATCQMSDHFAMILRGHKKCAERDNCHYWNQDSTAFFKAEYNAQEQAAYNTAIKPEKLSDYDYVYGGKMLLNTDPEDYPCDIFDHYAMIMQGHDGDECLRMGDLCSFWQADLHEWKTKGTIMGNSDWEGNKLKEYLEIYPTVEELEQ